MSFSTAPLAKIRSSRKPSAIRQRSIRAPPVTVSASFSHAASAKPPRVRVRPPAMRRRVPTPLWKLNRSLVSPSVSRQSPPSRSSSPSPSGGRTSKRAPRPVEGTLNCSEAWVAAVRAALTLAKLL
jgi:hypothetical protein